VPSWRRAIAVLLPLVALATYPAHTASQSAGAVTSPQQEFGAAIGDDYFLATYTQLERYWQKLDRESDRMQLVDIGRTEEGRPQWMAVISAPENLRRLDHYRDISRRLALAEGLSDEQASELARDGKAVVWIDGGLHADEVLGAQQLIELVYQLTNGTDRETERILRDVIVLAAHANPDGHELVAGWYMREREPVRRTLAGLPRLYQKYVGHDNNRDFYMSTQAETVNINRVLYRQWFPQIVYDHHQTGPPGTVMFAPPFREPSNYVFDPLIPAGIDLLGAAMHARFAAEGKPGVTMRTGSAYTTWWNGGLRTTAYFHNQIGLLTETIGSPTPGDIPFARPLEAPTVDLPNPIGPQSWRFRQSVDYSMTANRAVLDAASRFRETLLFNVYRMGKNSIQRGSQDWWTLTPRKLSRAPASRDARAYVLPSTQPDFPTATKFVRALLDNGIAVHRATAPFSAEGKSYPAGSYVIRTAQAFRPHVLDMFEPQDHPDDIPVAGAPPRAPYDSAGWTLAFQMGVKFDRLLEGVEGPFERIEAVSPPPGRVIDVGRLRDLSAEVSAKAEAAPPGTIPPATGYLVSHHQNDAFAAVNRLLAAGEDVYWPADRAANAMYIAARPSTLPLLSKAATDLGLTFTGVAAPPAGEALRLRPVRLGLWDRDGGAASSGWIRWLLERYQFPFEVVHAETLDLGGAARFDAVILADEASPSIRTSGITSSRTVPQLKAFVEGGGTLIAIGRATAVAQTLGLVQSALVERMSDGSTRPLRNEDYYIPGSVLRVAVDTTTVLGYGFEPDVDVFFDNSPVFALAAGRSPLAARRVAWFASEAPLRSGWAWGQARLKDGVAIAEVPLGRGRLLLFGPEVTFRGQSHATFKFLFNGILSSRTEPARLR
jgi:hypothetical protein